MDREKKRAGFLIALSSLLLVAFFAWAIASAESSVENWPSAGLVVVWVAASIGALASLVLLIGNALENESVKESRALWIVSFIALLPLTGPVYWWLHWSSTSDRSLEPDHELLNNL